MKAALRSLGLLTAFFLILSISVGGRPVFDYLHDFSRPATTRAQAAVEDFFFRSVAGTQTYSKKLFENSVPRVNAGRLRASGGIGVPADAVTAEDKARLDALIKNH
jgi:hypothetical protein